MAKAIESRRRETLGAFADFIELAARALLGGIAVALMLGFAAVVLAGNADASAAPAAVARDLVQAGCATPLAMDGDFLRIADEEAVPDMASAAALIRTAALAASADEPRSVAPTPERSQDAPAVGALWANAGGTAPVHGKPRRAGAPSLLLPTLGLLALLAAGLVAFIGRASLPRRRLA